MLNHFNEWKLSARDAREVEQNTKINDFNECEMNCNEKLNECNWNEWMKQMNEMNSLIV